MLASFQVTSGWGAFLAIVVMAALALLWVMSLMYVVADSISVFAKVIWFLALTLLAPVAIPVYFLTRHHRHAATAASAG